MGGGRGWVKVANDSNSQARGREEEVHAWIDSIDTDHELLVPTARFQLS
jgi:hypothetical protein